MDKCIGCGQAKDYFAPQCPSCQFPDPEVGNMPPAALPLLFLGIAIFWLYRFWRLGWSAWSGNLRLLAWLALGVSAATLVFGEMSSFGVRSRKRGALLMVISLAVLAGLQFV